MAKRQKFKISRTVIKTKRGKGEYAAHTLFVPEEIADRFIEGFFTVKYIGENIIYTLIKQDKNK